MKNFQNKVIPFVLAGLLVCGCDKSYLFTDVEDNCPDVDFSEEQSPQFVSTTCVEIIGDAFSVDWATFEEAPENVSAYPQTTSEVVLSGLITLISNPKHQTVAGFLEADTTPRFISEEIDRYASSQRISTSITLNEFWFHHFNQYVSQIVYDNSISANMLFLNNVVFVNDLSSTQNEQISSVKSSGIILHEFAHNFSDDHIACWHDGPLSCDPSANGAFGVGVEQIYRWIEDNKNNISEDVCWEEAKGAFSMCAMILDTTDFTPCEDILDICF